MERLMANSRQGLDVASRRLVSPAAYVQREKIRLAAFASRLSGAANRTTADAGNHLAILLARLQSERPDTANRHLQRQAIRNRISTGFMSGITRYRQDLASLQAQLELLSPERTLERGYAIITDKAGRVIRSPLKLPVPGNVNVRLAQGSAQVGIASVQPEIG
jgi:exodeoxyribonuclease VII large subunit